MGMKIWEYILILQKCKEDERLVNIKKAIKMLKYIIR